MREARQPGTTVGYDVLGANRLDIVDGASVANVLTVAELKQRMQDSGMDFARYRNTLRDQLVLQRFAPQG